jgi:1,4-dihydroxy-2-naphthoyl-CoA hydrolase
VYIHRRQIYFKDTDAAGVVYFANALSMCHEAYEAALADFGINVRQFFSNRGDTAMPIVHAEIDFYQPIFCGDRLLIQVMPELRSPYSFQISYTLFANCNTDSLPQLNQLEQLNQSERLAKLKQIISPLKPCAKGMSEHVCISTGDRRKTELPEAIRNWLKQN